MAKIAILVSFSPMTRIVVEAPEGTTVEEILNDDYKFAAVSKAAREKMANDLGDYLYGDNIESIVEDTEMPAEDKEKTDIKL